jgi:hypothetical protein
VSESTQHLRLVRSILAYLEREFADLAGFAIFDDTAEPSRAEKPPRINGYVPDVYVVDVPTYTTIIGEAKTRRDLERERSREQIAAFLEYLSHRPNGVFVLAVPLEAAATARGLVAAASGGQKAPMTRVVILDGVPCLTASRTGGDRC